LKDCWGRGLKSGGGVQRGSANSVRGGGLPSGLGPRQVLCYGKKGVRIWKSYLRSSTKKIPMGKDRPTTSSSGRAPDGTSTNILLATRLRDRTRQSREGTKRESGLQEGGQSEGKHLKASDREKGPKEGGRTNKHEAEDLGWDQTGES